MEVCKCGICIDDCEYHRPEYWDNVGFTTRPNPKVWLAEIRKLIEKYEDNDWIAAKHD